MNGDFLLDALEQIDTDLIEDAAQPPRRRPARWGWIAAAACLCVLIGGALLWPKAGSLPELPPEPGGLSEDPEPAAMSEDPEPAAMSEDPEPAAMSEDPEPGGLAEEPLGPMTDEELAVNGAQRWSETMSAADYFKNNTEFPEALPGEEASLVMPPYAARISLNDRRAALEAEGVLPEMPDHPEQDFSAEYNGDGMLHKVVFHWMRRSENGLDGYSDLTMTAAPDQWSELLDDIRAYREEAPATVTEHNGVLITATGGEGWNKTLSWWGEGGFYRIDGSWNDSFEDMVALLDWFWEHPLDLSPYISAPAELMRFADRSEYPEVFQDKIPDFAALGYEIESERLVFAAKTDFTDKETPVWFEGIYTRGLTRVRWTISAGADQHAWDYCLGRPKEVTREALDGAAADVFFGPMGFLTVTLFFDGDIPYMGFLGLQPGTTDDAWEIIQTLVR